MELIEVLFLTNYIFYFQSGNWRTDVPFNSSYWAPFDAHDPILIQEILLGLTRTPAEKADLAMAENTKICEFACYEIFNLPIYDVSMGASST